MRDRGAARAANAISHWSVGIGSRNFRVGYCDRTVGKELPAGSGSAKQGAPIYRAKCASCHGKAGRGGNFDVLVGGWGTLATKEPVKTIGSFWPYATTIWDYLNRAEPRDAMGSLTANQVYALTAYLLNLNKIISATDVMNATTLPKVRMPNRDGFVRDIRPDWEQREK